MFVDTGKTTAITPETAVVYAEKCGIPSVPEDLLGSTAMQSGKVPQKACSFLWTAADSSALQIPFCSSVQVFPLWVFS